MEPKPHPNGTTHKPVRPAPLYRECLRNHAAAMGAHALDGCGEFLPSPSSPLSCAACSCHRNFHRKTDDIDYVKHEEEEEEDDEAGSQVLLTLKTGGGTGPTGGKRDNDNKRKRRRHRSRFSREQKEGMMELAERLGWRLQRRDEGVVEEGCMRVGVNRGVFKVWMYNNKQAVLHMKRRLQATAVVNLQANAAAKDKACAAANNAHATTGNEGASSSSSLSPN